MKLKLITRRAVTFTFDYRTPCQRERQYRNRFVQLKGDKEMKKLMTGLLLVFAQIYFILALSGCVINQSGSADTVNEQDETIVININNKIFTMLLEKKWDNADGIPMEQYSFDEDNDPEGNTELENVFVTFRSDTKEIVKIEGSGLFDRIRFIDLNDTERTKKDVEFILRNMADFSAFNMFDISEKRAADNKTKYYTLSWQMYKDDIPCANSITVNIDMSGNIIEYKRTNLCPDWLKPFMTNNERDNYLKERIAQEYKQYDSFEVVSQLLLLKNNIATLSCGVVLRTAEGFETLVVIPIYITEAVTP